MPPRSSEPRSSFSPRGGAAPSELPIDSPAAATGPPLARKLGVTPGARVAALRAPAGFAQRLEDAVVASRLRGRYDVIVQFVPTLAVLERRIAPSIAALEPRGRLWIAWPKRSSVIASDLDDRVVRETMLASGLVDNKVCAIDETWSALCFVRRLAQR